MDEAIAAAVPAPPTRALLAMMTSSTVTAVELFEFEFLFFISIKIVFLSYLIKNLGLPRE